MKVFTIFDKIRQLQREIDQHGKLSKELLQKINYKFRLDWNYYSNRMEGGTLTKDETRSVMVGNITVDGKPIKDIMEMNGHDEVVRSILTMGKGEARLSEKRIKDIHRDIIKHDDDAHDDQPIGDWKTKNNEIINYKGEKITFTPPDEVADAIHKLLNKTNAALDALYASKPKAKHPLQIAADLHIGFVSIHPFFDGNGRTARILMNLILVACGYPPIIIDETAKQAYYKYLADIQAYAGNPDFFYGQMGQLLLKSQQLILDAIDGKDIEDEDDLDKRLELLKRSTSEENTIKVTKGQIDDTKFLETNILPLVNKLHAQYEKLEPLFAENHFGIGTDANAPRTISTLNDLTNSILIWSMNWSDGSSELHLIFNHSYLKQGGTKNYNYYYDLFLRLEKTKYVIYTKDDRKPLLERLYDKTLSEKEQNLIAKDYFKQGLDTIEDHLKFLRNKSK